MMSKLNLRRISVVLMLLFAFALPSIAQGDKTKKKQRRPAGTPVLWSDPTDIASRNLFLGAGGKQMKPDLRRVTFVEDKKGGYSKKYRVKDASGHSWVAKIGKEAQSDTAANRLLWAVGYPTEVAYLVPTLTIHPKGTFKNVRLEARPKSIDRGDEWKWANNPFVGTPAFQGLKVMMLLINNWDIKDSNNVIFNARNRRTGTTEARYVISDLGGSLGKTGNFITRSRNKPSDFVKSEFIESVKGDIIDFNYGGKNKSLFKDITVEDARWIGRLLERLSDEQIRDAFRAANYSPAEVDLLSNAMRKRIDSLNSVASPVASVP
jgi:hypothetical protein